MTFAELTKTSVCSASVGAMPAPALNFTWGLRATAVNTNQIALRFATEETKSAMASVFLKLSQAHTKRAAKLLTLQEILKFRLRDAVIKTGWAKLLSTDAPTQNLTNKYLAGFKLDEF